MQRANLLICTHFSGVIEGSANEEAVSLRSLQVPRASQLENLTPVWKCVKIEFPSA